MPAFDASSAPQPGLPSNVPQVLEPTEAGAPAAPEEAFSRESVRRIAHDLNNALATVSGYAQLLGGQPDWPPHLARQLQTLAHDAARAVALANELLLLTRFQPEVLASPPSSTEIAPASTSTSILPGEPSASPALEPARRAGQQNLGGAEILVVDDEEPVITLISEILSMAGYNVTPAFNGAEALACTKRRDFDLIISDVRMPAVGGPAFYEILQTERPDLLSRVLFVTGDTVSLSTRQFLAGTQRPVLAKPFDPDRLLDMVRQCLAS